MQKTMFKIWDNQLLEYHWNWEWFTTSSAIDNLANYHSIDWKWVDDYWTEQDIFQFLDTIENEEKRLEFLLEYWDWDIHHCIFRVWDVCYGWDYDRWDTLQNFIEWGIVDKPVQMEMRFYYEQHF